MSLSTGVVNWLNAKTNGSVEYDDNGTPKMSERSVRSLCLKNGGYECEEINDKLYLHFQGFKEIGGLEKYTGLKCLYLESNGLSSVSNLNHLKELRCLYLQQNLLKSIAKPAFEGLTNIVTLDISQNLLKSLDGLSVLVSLQSLNASKNYLSDVEGIKELEKCPTIASLDLRNNQLADEDVVGVIDKMSQITALYLQGNPCVKSMKHYRKKLIDRFPKLTYLDERPVDPHERTFAEAFVQGGAEAEKVAREEWKTKQKQQQQRELSTWNDFKAKARAKREEEIAAAKAQGLEPPKPPSFVSYRSVDPEVEEQRQDRLRHIAKAEAQATNETLHGSGIKMMGIKFAEETAKRNGTTFNVEALQEPVPDATQVAETEEARQRRVDESLRIFHERKAKEATARQRKKDKEAETVTSDICGVVVESAPVAPPPAPVSEDAPTSSELEWDDKKNSLLMNAVRENVFCFDKAAAEMQSQTGLSISSEQCRVQFAKLREKISQKKKSITQQQQKEKAIPEKSILATQSIEQEQQVVVAAQDQVDVCGRPMPKVGVQAPTELPSVLDFESDESPVNSPTLTEPNPIEEEADVLVRPEDGLLPKRLTREDILQGLHGSTDHPLAKELDLEGLD